MYTWTRQEQAGRRRITKLGNIAVSSLKYKDPGAKGLADQIRYNRHGVLGSGERERGKGAPFAFPLHLAVQTRGRREASAYCVFRLFVARDREGKDGPKEIGRST